MWSCQANLHEDNEKKEGVRGVKETFKRCMGLSLESTR